MHLLSRMHDTNGIHVGVVVLPFCNYSLEFCYREGNIELFGTCETQQFCTWINKISEL